MNKRISVPALVAAVGLVSSVVQPAPNRNTFAETVDVVVVEVPVRVPRDGDPVRGLTREDFELFDRGRPQSITGFEIIDLLEPSPQPFSERTALEWSLDVAELVTGDQAVTDFPVEVLIYPLPAGSDHRAVPLILQIPGRELASHATGSKLRVRVQVFAFGQDATHDLLDQQIQIDLDKLGAALECSGLRFEGALMLPVGSHRIRVVVRLLDSGKRFLLTIPVDIPSSDLRQIVLLPPVFVGRSTPYVRVRETQSAERAADTTAFGSFSIGGEGLVPVIAPTIEDEELFLLTLYLQDGPPPKLNARVVGEDGEAIAGGSFERLVRDSAAADDATRLLGLFRPLGLDAGAYDLEISLESPEGRAVIAGRAPFTVGQMSE